MNDSAEIEEILTCPLPPPAASTACRQTCGSFCIVSQKKETEASISEERDIEKIEGEKQMTTETKEIQICLLLPPVASTTGSYHHPAVWAQLLKA